jgi:hypothetical protein
MIYNDLRKDKIPFSYTVTLTDFRKMEIRNKEIREVPQLFSDQL